MTRPFHLSFAVSDLVAARAFYLDTLGCRIGRDKTVWFDVLFFGHQLTIHKASEDMPAVAFDHFGPTLDKETWLDIADECESRSVPFVLPPRVTADGTVSESGKFKILDPAGSCLEFKYYSDFHGTFGDETPLG